LNQIRASPLRAVVDRGSLHELVMTQI